MGDVISSKTIQIGIDGLFDDDVSLFLASDAQLESFRVAQRPLPKQVAGHVALVYVGPTSVLTREVPCSVF